MGRKLQNSELNRLSIEEFKLSPKLPVIVVLDNVRSQHNIGAAFRTGDAFRIESIFLCGISSIPPNAEIHKSALGAEDSVEWKYFANTVDAVTFLRQERYEIITIEQTENSIMLNSFLPNKNIKYAFVFGNEVHGVLQSIVDASDLCIEIPQAGTKHSLNVSVSVGVVLWEFYKNLNSILKSSNKPSTNNLK
ncbi:MAG: RNA methyltransferase [Prevotellaceae bacterium]|jgi:tRNA G18 (ribose-2'-O)-methylase SpoU|nr:RNA methyltransferase [Prevotellaceae bacterium]